MCVPAEAELVVLRLLDAVLLAVEGEGVADDVDGGDEVPDLTPGLEELRPRGAGEVLDLEAAQRLGRARGQVGH